MRKNPNFVIESMYEGFHRVEKLIADFILENYEFIIQNKLKVISEKIGVSESSIIRFCQIIGFSGFSDFKVALAQCSPTNEEENIFELENFNSGEAITKTTLLNNIEALKKTLEFINYSEVENAAQSLLKADKIIIAGVGYSGLIGKMFYHRMKTTGLHITYETDAYAMKQAELLLESNSIVFGISQSGKSPELIELFECAKKENVKTIALTTSANNKLTKLADIQLITALSNSDYIRNYYASEVVFKSILDSLYIQLNILLGDQNFQTANEIARDIHLADKARNISSD